MSPCVWPTSPPRERTQRSVACQQGRLHALHHAILDVKFLLQLSPSPAIYSIRALLVMAAATVAGQEGTVAVVSIPGVRGYLTNPCHLLSQQESPHVEYRDTRVSFDQLRQVALTNILFANVTLHAIQNILNSDCNIPFSLNTLPAVPSPYSLQQQDGYRVMHREFIFLLAHLYFAINNTDPTTTTCSHETPSFSHELQGLTGMLENLMCRLTVLVQSESQLAPAVSEVMSLRLQHEASCGGRGLWTCIVAFRLRRALSMLRRLLLDHGRRNHSPADNISVVSTQQKRFSRRRSSPNLRQGAPLDSLHRRPSAAFFLGLRQYLPRTYSSNPHTSDLLDYAVPEFSNALASPNNHDSSSNNSPSHFNIESLSSNFSSSNGSDSSGSHDYLHSAEPSQHFDSNINSNTSGTSNIPDSSNSLKYINTVAISPSRLAARGGVPPLSFPDFHEALTSPRMYFPLRGYFFNHDRSKDQHTFSILGSSNKGSFPSNSSDSKFLFYSNNEPDSSYPSNVSYANKPSYFYRSSYSQSTPYSYPSSDFNSRTYSSNTKPQSLERA